MKRLFLFILAVNLMISAFASGYFAEGTTWTTSFRSAYGGCDDWTKTCVMLGDTLIGDNTYHNILYNDGHRQLTIPIREESKRIFAYLNNEDHLLYDFNLEVGDSLPICVYGADLYCAYYTHVTAVDSITLSDGRKAKRLTYDLERLPDIEFVGGMYGFLAPMVTTALTTCGGGPSSCCSLNDEPIYETSPGTCARLNPQVTPPVCADTWHAIAYKWYLIPYPSEYIDVQYNLTTDTIIGDYTYRKLIRDNTTCVGGLRQTDDGMKVYYYDMASPAEWPFSHVDCLLYDFSANIGDTIKNAYFRTEDVHSDYCYCAEFVSWVVLDKDTIDGRIHMMVARYDSLGYYDPAFVTEWIQGVGTRHVLWPDDYGLEDMGGFNTVYALCAMHGDEALYSYDLTLFNIVNNCTEWHFKKTALNDIQADNTRARKFLRDGQLLIQTPLGTFNARGQQVN